MRQTKPDGRARSPVREGGEVHEADGGHCVAGRGLPAASMRLGGDLDDRLTDGSRASQRSRSTKS
ncbi:MAG: hypothetical protein M0008_09730 [Actinomycetota bacterium]|nr:hypothetical protein [Actinomycetota bacterium]